ncbi:hypothetical protein MASR2M74_01690 [Paracoccaceae bacterium]
MMIAAAPHLRTDDQIATCLAQAVEVAIADMPRALQDDPLTLTVQMSVGVVSRIMAGHPSCLMLKAEDGPGLEKLPALREAQPEGRLRPFSIQTAKGGLLLNPEPECGSDGAMKGEGFPDMLVDIDALRRWGGRDAAHALLDPHLPLIRYERQPDIGLALCKHVLMRRGVIASDT